MGLDPRRDGTPPPLWVPGCATPTAQSSPSGSRRPPPGLHSVPAAPHPISEQRPTPLPTQSSICAPQAEQREGAPPALLAALCAAHRGVPLAFWPPFGWLMVSCCLPEPPGPSPHSSFPAALPPACTVAASSVVILDSKAGKSKRLSCFGCKQLVSPPKEEIESHPCSTLCALSFPFTPSNCTAQQHHMVWCPITLLQAWMGWFNVNQPGSV